MKVNGIEVETTSFDNFDIIIKRYSIKIKEPSIFYKGDGIISNNISLKRFKIPKGIMNNNFEDKIKKILNDYPDLKLKDIAMEWIKENKITEYDLFIHLNELSKIDPISFKTIYIAQKTLKEYPKRIESLISQDIKDVNDINNISKEIGNKIIPISPFELNEVEIKIDYEYSLNLLNLFNDILVDNIIPFVYLRYKGKDYFKCYKLSYPPVKWLSEIENIKKGIENKIIDKKKLGEYSLYEEDLIYFKYLSAPGSCINSRSIKYENLFSDISYKNFNNNEKVLIFNYNLLYSEKDIPSALNEIETHINNFKIKKHTKLTLKGKAIIQNFQIDRIAFADIIQFSLLKKLFYMYEFNKTINEKERFNFYYSPTNENGILINLSMDKNDIIMKLSRAKSQCEVDNFLKSFTKILGYYSNNFMRILNEYKEFVNVKIPDLTIQYKEGRRASILYNYDSELFPKLYSAICQKPNQPLPVLNPKEYISKYGKHKILEYPVGKGKYYACDPQEEEDNPNIWIGLKKNNKGGKYDYVPCCFKINQFTKSRSGLLDGLKGVKVVKKEIKENDVGYIKKAGKKIAENRYGELPYYIKILFEMNGIENVFSTNVGEGYDELIKCLVKGSDINAEDVIEEMLKLDYSYYSQEMYNFTIEDIREYISIKRKIKPEYFTIALENLLGINIITFIINPEFPNGNFMRVNTSNVFLHSHKKRETKFILQTPTQILLIVFPNIENNQIKNVKYSLSYDNPINKWLYNSMRYTNLYFEDDKVYFD